MSSRISEKYRIYMVVSTVFNPRNIYMYVHSLLFTSVVTLTPGGSCITIFMLNLRKVHFPGYPYLALYKGNNPVQNKMEKTFTVQLRAIIYKIQIGCLIDNKIDSMII